MTATAGDGRQQLAAAIGEATHELDNFWHVADRIIAAGWCSPAQVEAARADERERLLAEGWHEPGDRSRCLDSAMANLPPAFQPVFEDDL